MITYTLDQLIKLHEDYLLTEDNKHIDEQYDTARGLAMSNNFLWWLGEREKERGQTS